MTSTQAYTEQVLNSEKPWLLHFGHAEDHFSVTGLQVYEQLALTFANVSFGFVDIRTHEGELLKASFGIEIIPWSYFVQTQAQQRRAYRFNGLESEVRLALFLTNVTKWEAMDS